MRCAPRASNGLNHLGFVRPSGIKLHGLDFRVKSALSISRKVRCMAMYKCRSEDHVTPVSQKEEGRTHTQMQWRAHKHSLHPGYKLLDSTLNPHTSWLRHRRCLVLPRKAAENAGTALYVPTSSGTARSGSET